jgi:hypothetical protein
MTSSSLGFTYVLQIAGRARAWLIGGGEQKESGLERNRIRIGCLMGTSLNKVVGHRELASLDIAGEHLADVALNSGMPAKTWSRP